MSSSSQYMQNSTTKNSTVVRLGDIEHLTQLSEHLSSLCLSHEYADITLVVEGQKLYAHKVILAARSEYFRALLYGGLKETNQSEIVLPDAPVKAFKILLKYIYTGHMFLMTLKEDVILDTLGLAHQYGFLDLETAISDILKQLLALRNVCAILDTAHLYGLEKLVDVCHAFLDRHASEILVHETFLQLSQDSLVELLQRDSFFAPEVEIFRGVCNWCTANVDKDDLVMKCVRLPLMNVADLLSVVRPAGLVKPDALLDAIAERTNVRLSSLPHRGQLGGEESSLSEYEPLAKRARKKPPLQPPTDDEIRIYLMEILENANLEHVSMNMIILQVYAHYSGFNLESRKDLIKAIVLSLINT